MEYCLYKVYRINGYSKDIDFKDQMVMLVIDLTVRSIGTLETSILLIFFIIMIRFFFKEIQKNQKDTRALISTKVSQYTLGWMTTLSILSNIGIIIRKIL